MSSANSELPAILGGPPVRPQGPPDWPPADPAIADALQRALAEGTWGKYVGPRGEELTARLRSAHVCEHVVLCSSGTAAVELALRGLKVGPGDEVILAAYDFKGNIQNVLAVGAMPVLVDLDPENWNLEPTRLEAAITPATKAIIVSHLHGGIVPMPAVVEIAATRGMAVIEDACQMPGARIHGRPAGTWGDVGVLSFGGSKLLSAGRGGALLTNRADIVQRIRLHTFRGNEAYPLSELQAAVLVPQLDRLEERNRRRAANVAASCRLLKDVPGLRPLRNPRSDSEPGYYKLGLQYDPAAFDHLPRDDFAAAMRAEGIALDPGFRALYRVTSPRRFRPAGELANAGEADARMLKLHHPVLLEDEDDLRQIVLALEKIRAFARMIKASVVRGPLSVE
jgi:dTDP-4-amino-4,6-dideoxygalactose transaminase